MVGLLDGKKFDVFRSFDIGPESDRQTNGGDRWRELPLHLAQHYTQLHGTKWRHLLAEI